MKLCVVLLVFMIVASTDIHALPKLYVYISNQTNSTIIANDRLRVRPHQQHILETIQVAKHAFKQQKFRIKGSIKIWKMPKAVCYYDFISHTILDSDGKEFKTFLIVKKMGNKYVCQPSVAEVYPQSNTLKRNGQVLSIEAAYKRHGKWKEYIEENVPSVIIINPYTGFGRLYKPRVRRSH